MIAITGNTYPVKDRLRSLGCRWDRQRGCWTAATEQMAAEAQAVVAGKNLTQRGVTPTHGSDGSTLPSSTDEADAKREPGLTPGVATPSAPAASKEPQPATLGTSVAAEAGGDRVWSGEQNAIFDWFRHGKGNLVVQARAGSGKTTTVKEAFGHAPEDSMLYVVFNKRNQKEAEAKISDPRVEVKTLHSLGYKYILAVWKGVKPDTDVERDRIASVVRDIPDEVGTAVAKLVSFAKNTAINPTVDDLEDIADTRGIEATGYEEPENGGWTVRRIAEVASKVLEASTVKDVQGRISFDDMVWLPVRMNWVRGWYDLVVVDEAQDQSPVQLEMVRHAAKKTGRVCVVGDTFQCIYQFRGAANDGMETMKQKLAAKELGLTITYRCAKAVVALANALVPDYHAAPTAPEGLVTDINEGALSDEVKVGDFVLSRINAPLMGICLGLLRKGVPARIEGKDIGKQLVGIVRKLKARTVPHFIERIEAWGAKQRKRAGKSKHAEERCDTINDQVATLVAVAEGAANVLEIETRLLNLFQDSNECSKPAVVLSTVHKAKGLEAPRVFLLEKTFNRKPSPGGKVQSGEGQAAKNVRYVAITRAMRHLTRVHEGSKQEAAKPEPQERAAATAAEVLGNQRN